MNFTVISFKWRNSPSVFHRAQQQQEQRATKQRTVAAFAFQRRDAAHPAARAEHAAQPARDGRGGGREKGREREGAWRAAAAEATASDIADLHTSAVAAARPRGSGSGRRRRRLGKSA